MSQNTSPPSPPDNPSSDVPGEPNEDRNNPYFASARGQDFDDLDANAPNLRVEEGQRLNRRALLFLGATLLLILVMAVMFLKMFNSSDGDKAVAKRERSERAIVPDAPVVEPALPLAQQAPVEPVAPLPLEEPREYGTSEVRSAREDRPRGPSLIDRRIADSASSGLQGGADDASPMAGAGGAVPRSSEPGAQPPIQAQLAETSFATYLQKPDTLLLRGTYIRCVLETHIVTDVSGFTSCVVTEPVYSVNGRSLLLPKGSKISGTYSGGGGRTNRVSVIWDRVTTPNGLDILMSSPGVDNLGGAGHPGDLDNHWASKITSALMISLIADAFKYAGEKNGPQRTTITQTGTTYIEPYESETANTAQRLSEQMISQQMARSPTITINQGTVLNVYVAKDVDFSGVLASNQQ